MLSLSFPVLSSIPTSYRPLCRRNVNEPIRRYSTFQLAFDHHHHHRPRLVSRKVILAEGGHDDRYSPPHDHDQTVRKLLPLPEGLQPELMPNHVALIFECGSRLGQQQQRGSPPMDTVDRTAGGRKLKEMVTRCFKWGVKVVTVLGFSTEKNWLRPKEEVDILTNIFGEGVIANLQETIRLGARIYVIGDRSKVPTMLRNLLFELEEATKTNSQFHLIAALNYDGQYDITQACKKVARKVKEGHIQVEDINKKLIQQQLQTNCTEYPNPDLVICNSREPSVGNFLLWQLAYTELHFTNKMWSDIEEADLAEAFRSFQQRQRSYGGQA